MGLLSCVDSLRALLHFLQDAGPLLIGIWFIFLPTPCAAFRHEHPPGPGWRYDRTRPLPGTKRLYEAAVLLVPADHRGRVGDSQCVKAPSQTKRATHKVV